VLENDELGAEPNDRRRIGELSDLCTPWSVHVAATLRVSEHIAGGVDRIDEIAAAAGCDADFLRRVLNHLVSKGVFRQPEPGRFALNGPARALLDPRLRLSLDLDGFGGRLAHAWGTLLAAVRSGRSAYHEAFGLPFWEDMEAHPEIAASVEDSLRFQGRRPDPEVLVGDDWTGIRTVVDVGGGNGDLLAEILRTRPAVSGVLVDLPRTVARSAGVFEAAGVAERATTAGQSFLDPLPASADLYVLRNVLAVCQDDVATTLLSRCAEAAHPATRIVVVGGVTPDDAVNGLSPELVLVGGKERGLTEFESLASVARLEVVATGRQRSGQFVVECRQLVR
jgi:hypothetical protein